jgi:hypothetical protein
MASIFRSSNEYELLPRTSLDLEGATEPHNLATSYPGFSRNIIFWILLPLRLIRRIFYQKGPSHRTNTRWLSIRGLYWTLAIIASIVALLIAYTAIFQPSYAHPPTHYKTLEKECKQSQTPGRGNLNNQKVFISSTLYDQNGLLAGGKWGQALLELVQLLGPDNTFLSVYENDPDPLAREALDGLGKKLACNTSLVYEHLSLDDLPHINLPNGESAIKRMAFLSEVRNRALLPIQFSNATKFDKVLFINDVVFNPIDAAQLLFSTNIDSSGYSQYDAACAMDFINPFKFYDTFATRDSEGYSMGIPFYPWFTNAGKALSRQDVLDQKDAVRVQACWGGMVAFDAALFQTSQGSKNGINLPLHFRYEPDIFWDASECCLIHADLADQRTTERGIFANPFIRVAYESSTLAWLPYTRRIERLYSFIHNILNHLVGLPAKNPHRLEQPGDEVVEKVWQPDLTVKGTPKGAYHTVTRSVEPGRFCGMNTLQIWNEHPKKGEKKFTIIRPPA